jgi:predicted NAD/FAD-dependent oxidoreductase
MKQRIAIIGAGISGLTLAQNLREYYDVVVFEKARGVLRSLPRDLVNCKNSSVTTAHTTCFP